MTLARRSATRRFLPGLLVGLGVLAAAHAGLWFFVTARMEDELAVWLAQCRAAGWSVAAGQPVRGGWPMEAAIVVPDLVLAGAEADLPGGVSWRAARMELSVALLRPSLVEMRAVGGQRLRLATLPEFAFDADRFVVSIPLVAGQPGRAAGLSAAGLRAALPTGELGIATLVGHAETRAATAGSPGAVSFTAAAEAIGLPPLPRGRPWPLGPRIGSVSVDATLTGDLPGATLEVRRLAAAWGPLGLSASASMAWDSHRQPMGAAMARMVGYDATLDALTASGVLAPRVALAVRAVLGILARSPDGGGAPQIELPLTLQDRVLAAGGFPLAKMPELVWP